MKQRPDRQLEVVAGRAHGGGDQVAVEADLEGLLDDHVVGPAPVVGGAAGGESTGEHLLAATPGHARHAIDLDAPTVRSWPLPSSTPPSNRSRSCSASGRGRARASTRRSTRSPTPSTSPSGTSASRSSPTCSAPGRPTAARCTPRPATSGWSARRPRSTLGHAVELVLSMPTGVVEVLAGTVVDDDISLTSTLVGLSPTAKRVDATDAPVPAPGRHPRRRHGDGRRRRGHDPPPPQRPRPRLTRPAALKHAPACAATARAAAGRAGTRKGRPGGRPFTDCVGRAGARRIRSPPCLRACRRRSPRACRR